MFSFVQELHVDLHRVDVHDAGPIWGLQELFALDCFRGAGPSEQEGMI